MNEPIVLYCDGLCEPNPGGWACWGWLAYDPAGVLIGEGQACLRPAPENTNNTAEYSAVLAALRWAYQTGYRAATVRTDSQLVVKQVRGEYGCYSPHIVPLWERACTAAGLMALTWEWVPRDQNVEADTRSRAAYIAATGHPPPVHRPRRPGHKPAAHTPGRGY